MSRGVTSALVLAAIGALVGCEAVKQFSSDMLSSVDKPSAEVAGVSFSGLDLESLGLDFDVEVTNPYDFDLPLTDLAYSLASGDHSFLSGSVAPEGSVPANGTSTVTLPTKVWFTDLVGAVGGIEPGSVVPYTADFELSLDNPLGDAIKVPFRKSGEVPVPTVPEVSVQGIDFEELSMSRAAATLSIGVENTNDFPFTLSELTYDFALADKRIAKAGLASAEELEGGSSKTLEIPLEFAPMDLGMAVFNVLSGDDAGFDLSGVLDLDTPFGRALFPYEKTGRVPLSQ